MRRFGAVLAMACGLVFGVPAVAGAASVSECIPTSGNVTAGACSGTGHTVTLPASSADQQTLISLLPHVKFKASGVGGKPTVQFTGVNVQIVNGTGKTVTLNGTGNLVIGYDENPRAQTGSHNLVVGANQSFTSYAGLVAGGGNTASGPYASVTGGFGNTAADPFSSVHGGCGNVADHTVTTPPSGNAVCDQATSAGGQYESILGGRYNLATWTASAVVGGVQSWAKGFQSAVLGGENNTASGDQSTVAGGAQNAAAGRATAVAGGAVNTPKEYGSSIAGGCGNLIDHTAGGPPADPDLCGNAGEGQMASITGGLANLVKGTATVVVGGLYNTGGGWASTIGGGDTNTVGGTTATVSGGAYNLASDYAASVSGGCGGIAGSGTVDNFDCQFQTGYEWVGGGTGNQAAADTSSVAGGWRENETSAGHTRVGPTDFVQ